MGTPYKFLKKFCEEYELPRVSVHSMRHTNATLLINNGTNIKAVQGLLGHSTAVTTVNIPKGHTHTLHNNYAISIQKKGTNASRIRFLLHILL